VFVVRALAPGAAGHAAMFGFAVFRIVRDAAESDSAAFIVARVVFEAMWDAAESDFAVFDANLYASDTARDAAKSDSAACVVVFEATF
jgi:hypothetical protein